MNSDLSHHLIFCAVRSVRRNFALNIQITLRSRTKNTIRAPPPKQYTDEGKGYFLGSNHPPVKLSNTSSPFLSGFTVILGYAD
jgi:hypothetical protein